MDDKLIEGEDYYYNEQGYVVLTEKFHLKKGYCCGNGCKHCPYDYINVPEPKRKPPHPDTSGPEEGLKDSKNLSTFSDHEKE